MKIEPKYNSFETSEEIIQAIEERYAGKIIDSESDAYTEWADPSEINVIIKRAWELADDKTTSLHWGMETYKNR